MKIHPENKNSKEEERRPVDSADSIDESPASQIEAASADDLPGESASGPATIESLRRDLADAEKRVLLAQADLENFRRRNRRDMQDQLKYASMDLMSEILDSLDNLQRAVESYEQDPNGDGLVEGVKLVAQQMLTTLENKGCKKIDAVGQPFDPTRHQAIQMQPSDEFSANTVMMDLRPGFQLHERVVRPSQVFVSQGPEQN